LRPFNESKLFGRFTNDKPTLTLSLNKLKSHLH